MRFKEIKIKFFNRKPKEIGILDKVKFTKNKIAVDKWWSDWNVDKSSSQTNYQKI